jgi:iron complex outermembrane receptor protein
MEVALSGKSDSMDNSKALASQPRVRGYRTGAILRVVFGRTLCVCLCLAAPVLTVRAQDPADLSGKTLEELMDIKVTSASKKEEKLFRTAAAIFVITQDDIRRSGMTHLPELLRLVPGLDVAQIDGNKWAISSRGFNGRFADKLLVLVDGRSVYTPETGGVYWEVLDLPLENIDRIEVIRGPGGTLWGANAVNGVINIITKSAKDTQGGLATVGAGSEDRGFGSVRYGGKIGDSAYYRGDVMYFDNNGLLATPGVAANDGRSMIQGGGRIDWDASRNDLFTFQGDFSDSHLTERPALVAASDGFGTPANTPGDLSDGNLLGRWNHFYSGGSDCTLQVYFDEARRNVWDFGERIDTLDLDFQHHFGLGSRQDIVWGLGVRAIFDQTDTNIGTAVQFSPRGQSSKIADGFIQDEISVVKDRLQLTVGAKLEHDDFTGFNLQPSVRMLWAPAKNQTLWAAVSRAVRTPAFADEGIRVNLAAFPGPGGLTNLLALFGNSEQESEELVAYEFGYRVEPMKKLFLDVATFFNDYNRLQTDEPGIPFLEDDPPPTHLVTPIVFGNLMRGSTYGIEVAATLNLTSRWKVQGSYSFLRMELHPLPDSHDFALAAQTEGESPQHQFQLHSAYALPRNLELDASLYYVSRLPSDPVPGYTRIDARLAWHAAESLELSLGLQNLGNNDHPELIQTIVGVKTSLIKTDGYAKLAWWF